MAITTPTDIQITPDYELLVPLMAQQPLRRALENCNYLWQYHRPALVTACYNADPAVARASGYHIPIVPSADSLRYTFEHRVICSDAAQAITVSVDETDVYAGVATVWANIYSAAEVSGLAGVLNTWEHVNQTIPDDAVALRVSYTAPAAGTRTDHHVLCYPSPGVATAGIQPSGFIPFDDGMLSHADLAPVHTELVNRCKESASAILRDRKQCAFSFVQEYRLAFPYARLRRFDAEDWFITPVARVWLPHQGPTVDLAFKVMGEVSGGVSLALLRVAQVGATTGQTLTFDADSTISTGTLTCEVQSSGLMAYVDLQFSLRSTAGNSIRPSAVVAYYTPGS